MSEKRDRGPVVNFKVIIKESGGVFVVETRKLHAKPGNTVAFYNGTKGGILIFFPELDLFSKPTQRGNVVPVASRAWSDAFKIQGAKRGQKKDNHYPYAVFCEFTGEFAIASSNPEIIIDWQ
jgi:hypothetical protein